MQPGMTRQPISISIVIPTIPGREEHYGRNLAAYVARTHVPFEIIKEYDHPSVGLAWQAGAERAKGSYIALSCDDLEIQEGWDAAAMACCDSGRFPAPRVVNAATGAVESRPQWGVETPEGTDTGISVVPFMSRAQYEKIAPFFTAHYYCCVPETRVLTAGMRWVESAKLAIGDEIAGVDEFPAASADRKFRRAVVTGTGTAVRECATVMLDDGREITCSLDHPWLVKTWRKGNPASERQASLQWIETVRLRPGDQIASPLRTWDADQSRRSGWLAGVMDGEGTAGRYGSGQYKTTSLSIAQNPGTVLNTVKDILDVMGIAYSEAPNAVNSQVTVLRIRSISGVMELLGRVRPMRLKADGLWEGASIRTKQPGQYATVAETVFVGRQEVTTLGTSTGTFLAEGLVSHNTDDFISDRARDNGWPSVQVNAYCFKHHWAQHGRGAGMTENERMVQDQQLYYQARVMVANGQWDKPWPPDGGRRA